MEQYFVIFNPDLNKYFTGITWESRKEVWYNDFKSAEKFWTLEQVEEKLKQLLSDDEDDENSLYYRQGEFDILEVKSFYTKK